MGEGERGEEGRRRNRVIITEIVGEKRERYREK